jgi:hypothetical protein
MMKVRVDVAVLPAASVATYSMVSVTAAGVSIMMLLTSPPRKSDAEKQTHVTRR